MFAQVLADLLASAAHMEIGRFLSQDPLRGSPANPQTQNRYTYAHNNPVRYVDPFGLRSTEGGIWGRMPWWVGIAVPAAAFEPTPVGEVILIGTCLIFCNEVIDAAFDTLFSDGEDPAQHKKLSDQEARALKRAGYPPERLKEEYTGSKKTGQFDLYKNREGRVIVKPKGGRGPGVPTDIWIK